MLTIEQLESIRKENLFDLKLFLCYGRCGATVARTHAPNMTLYYDKWGAWFYHRCDLHRDDFYKLSEKEVFTFKCLHNL